MGVQSLPTANGGALKHIHPGSRINSEDRVLTKTIPVAITATGGTMIVGGDNNDPPMTIHFVMIKDGPLSDAQMLSRYIELKAEFAVTV